MATEAVAQQYSGFWRRLGGLIIDAIIVGVISAIIDAIVKAVAPDATALQGIVGLVIGLIYYIWGWGTGQSVGMMLLKMRMVDQTTGAAPGYGKAVIRYIIQIICGVTVILFIIGGLWLLWDAKKQTWWDKVAGTIVVDA
jgi:uncharacterized RDD family membrane protein YckC